MRIPGGNHLHRQRSLSPRDYATVPERFGHDANLAFELPDGGDEASLRLSIVQHRVVCRWRVLRGEHGAPSGAELARRFGCSKQTISASATGHRWACGVVYAAWITTLWSTRPDR